LESIVNLPYNRGGGPVPRARYSENSRPGPAQVGGPGSSAEKGASAPLDNGRAANQASAASDTATAAMLAHWLPVRPNQVRSRLKKSGAIRPAPYRTAKARNRGPARRSLPGR